MGTDYDVDKRYETGSPERLAYLQEKIRKAEEKMARAHAAWDGAESCIQKMNINIWRHAILREYGDGEKHN